MILKVVGPHKLVSKEAHHGWGGWARKFLKVFSILKSFLYE